MTAKELRRVEAAYRAASTRAKKAADARNAAILAAIAEGMTHAQIAQATGLSRARIGHIKTAHETQTG